MVTKHLKRSRGEEEGEEGWAQFLCGRRRVLSESFQIEPAGVIEGGNQRPPLMDLQFDEWTVLSSRIAIQMNKWI